MKGNTISNTEEITKETYQQTDANETQRFWAKIWQPKKKYSENAEWMNNITRELEGLDLGPKAEIPTDLLKMTLKKITNLKMQGHYGILGFWFKKLTSIQARQALEMNKLLQIAHVPE